MCGPWGFYVKLGRYAMQEMGLEWMYWRPFKEGGNQGILPESANLFPRKKPQGVRKGHCRRSATALGRRLRDRTWKNRIRSEDLQIAQLFSWQQWVSLVLWVPKQCLLDQGSGKINEAEDGSQKICRVNQRSCLGEGAVLENSLASGLGGMETGKEVYLASLLPWQEWPVGSQGVPPC